MWELRPLGTDLTPHLEKGRKTLGDGDTPESTGTLELSRYGRVTLRREQWKRLDNEHRGKLSLKKTSRAETSERKNRRYACRLFRTNNLKEGAM
jgi:hypothetical protein